MSKSPITAGRLRAITNAPSLAACSRVRFVVRGPAGEREVEYEGWRLPPALLDPDGKPILGVPDLVIVLQEPNGASHAEETGGADART